MISGRITIVAALALAGCYRGSAQTVSAGDVARQPGWRMVAGMTLIRQVNEHDCGPAALAMVLQRWGTAAPPSDLRGLRAGTAGDQGVAAGVLRDAARQRGLDAFLIHGEEADLVREVTLDRPVLVGLVQRYTSRSYAHYAVVVGINQQTRQILMLDPGRGLREDAFAGFAAEWGGAGRLTLIIGPR